MTSPLYVWYIDAPMPHRQKTANLTPPDGSPSVSEARRPATVLLGLPHFRGRRHVLQAGWILADLLVFAGAALGSSYLLERSLSDAAWSALAVAALVRIVAFVRLGMYRAALRYSGVHTMAVTCAGIGLGSAVAVAVGWFTGNHGLTDLGRAFLVLEALLAIGFAGGNRLAARLLLEPRWGGGGIRVLVFGAGDLGELTLRNLRRHPLYRPIGFLDDDADKKGVIIHGRQVLGGLAELDAICARHRPQAVFIAISNIDPVATRTICQACMRRDLRVSVVRGVEAGSGQLRLRDLKLEDLLPRPSRCLDPAPVRGMLAGRTVLVTGAGGSIGSELCEQIAAAGATELVLLDHSEYNLYAIEARLRGHHPETRLVPVLDNLLDRQRLQGVMARHRPSVIFHAAAYKHVPMVEANPFAATLNNVQGFFNLLRTADHVGVEKLVLISSDKAVRPTNVMGATKRACELLMQNFPAQSLRTCAVRFGNVLGSSGSVVPLFLEQIERGGPVTITHPDITRYFMLIPEAVALVLASGAMAEHGELFILDMGEPVKIADLARQLIYLAGKHPDEIPLAYTGLRPGEKLFEELLVSDGERGTPIPGITVAKPSALPWEQVEHRVARLLEACHHREVVAFARALKELIPEWTPSEEFAGAFSGEVPVTTPRQQASGRIRAAT